MKKLNICFITQKYDENDPYRANVVEWIKQISQNKKVNHLHIITRYRSKKELFDKCSISDIDEKFRIFRLFKFYYEIFTKVSKNSIIFIHMGGPYAINIFLFKILFGIKVYQWWAHPIIGISTKIGFYLTVDKLFTCTEGSFPLLSNKKIIVGHGINVQRFPLRNKYFSKHKSLITASRLTQRKNIHKMINLVHFLNKNSREKINLVIYGSPLTSKDKLYEQYLIDLIDNSQVSHLVKIYPAVKHYKLHSYYQEHNIYLNFSETALDKSILEAMSTGIPILSCNECFGEIIKDESLKNLITFNKFDDFSLVSQKVFKLLNFTEEEFAEYASRSNQFIKNNHSIENLTSSIVNNMVDHMS